MGGVSRIGPHCAIDHPFKSSPSQSTAKPGNQATRMVSHSWRNLFTHLMAAIIADALDKDYFSPIADQLMSGKLNDLRAQLRFMDKLNTTYWVCINGSSSLFDEQKNTSSQDQ